MSDSNEVLIHDHDGVRTITLNRPARRNALTADVQERLTAALNDVDGLRAVVLRGAGEAFCAGMDIEALRSSVTMTPAEQVVESERTARMFHALWACAVPTMAVVQGAAMAGGTGLATMTDFTFAVAEAKFGYTEARIGFVPALVSAYLSLQVGDKVARGLLLSARVFGADEALRLGLITEVVARASLEERAEAMVRQILSLSPQSLRATKRLLRAQQIGRLGNLLTMAMEANANARRHEDFCEGVSAFLEKRKPMWTA